MKAVSTKALSPARAPARWRHRREHWGRRFMCSPEAVLPPQPARAGTSMPSRRPAIPGNRRVVKPPSCWQVQCGVCFKRSWRASRFSRRAIRQRLWNHNRKACSPNSVPTRRVVASRQSNGAHGRVAPTASALLPHCDFVASDWFSWLLVGGVARLLVNFTGSTHAGISRRDKTDAGSGGKAIRESLSGHARHRRA